VILTSLNSHRPPAGSRDHRRQRPGSAGRPGGWPSRTTSAVRVARNAIRYRPISQPIASTARLGQIATSRREVVAAGRADPGRHRGSGRTAQRAHPKSPAAPTWTAPSAAEPSDPVTESLQRPHDTPPHAPRTTRVHSDSAVWVRHEPGRSWPASSSPAMRAWSWPIWPATTRRGHRRFSRWTLSRLPNCPCQGDL
jgi:hypothetical protein